jgi:hypothetical protein
MMDIEHNSPQNPTFLVFSSSHFGANHPLPYSKTPDARHSSWDRVTQSSRKRSKRLFLASQALFAHASHDRPFQYGSPRFLSLRGFVQVSTPLPPCSSRRRRLTASAAFRRVSWYSAGVFPEPPALLLLPLAAAAAERLAS